VSNSLLRDEAVVRQEIIVQCLFEFGGARKVGLLAKFVDVSIEAFDHAICLGMARRDEAMVDLGAGVGPVEDVIAGRLLLPGSEAVGELRAVVRQDRANVNRAGGLQAFGEVQAAFFALVIVDVQENPTAGAVNGDEKIASGRFVRHSGQVLDVDMDKPRSIFLESLLLGI
jgi:hypothetical protein